MNNLASLLQAQNKLAEAEALFREAWQGVRSGNLEDSRLGYVIQGNYGMCLAVLGRSTEAEGQLEASLKGLEATLGLEHARAQKVLRSLVHVFEAQRRFARSDDSRRKLVAGGLP